MKNLLRYPALCFLLLLGAHLLGAPSGAETDSTKDKYPLNDPRNPNCPCHKYQQQADAEYAKLLNASKQNNSQTEVKTVAVSEASGKKKIRTKHWRHSFASSHKMKVTKRKCFRDRLSRCFHF